MKLRALIAIAILAVFAVPAFAADHDFTLSADKTQHEWSGAPDVTRGSPVNDPATREQLGCSTPARPCEEVLIKVDEAGKFSATVTGQPAPGGQLTTDVDAWLYKSDASGTYQQGESIASGTASGPDTVSVAKAQPGFYLLVVDYYNAYGSGYDGVLKFTPAAPAAPAVTAPAIVAPAPAPAAASKPAAKKKKKKASCAAKAKKIKNSKKRAKAQKKCKKAAKKKKKKKN